MMSEDGQSWCMHWQLCWVGWMGVAGAYLPGEQDEDYQKWHCQCLKWDV